MNLDAVTKQNKIKIKTAAPRKTAAGADCAVTSINGKPEQPAVKATPALKGSLLFPSPKHIGRSSFFDRKQLLSIAVTFMVTFIFTLAAGKGLASTGISFEFSKSGTSTNQSSLAVSETPAFVELAGEVLDIPREVYLPKENINLPDPLQKRKEFLEKYLSDRGSVLAEHVDAISEQSQWKLIIAISRAESSFCKRHARNNCWGIGGAWNLKKYKNYDEAVADVNRILETKYIQAGLDTPKKIVKKYVGYQSDNWEYAVEQELENLKNIE